MQLGSPKFFGTLIAKAQRGEYPFELAETWRARSQPVMVGWLKRKVGAVTAAPWLALDLLLLAQAVEILLGLVAADLVLQ